MININAVQSLNGEKIVPVRAIPFVTGGDMNPRYLAGILSEPKHCFLAFVLGPNDVVTQMLPKNWKQYQDQLAVISTDANNLDLVNRTAVEILPASTFVYWEALWRTHEALFLPSREEIYESPPEEHGNYELQPIANIPKALVELVFEGFRLSQTEDRDLMNPVQDQPTPLTTSDIAYSFADLKWSEAGWKKPLGDKPKWLRGCVAIPGSRGVSETHWNPVLIGAALIRDGHVRQNSVRAKFQTIPLLQPWLESWRTYEADNLSDL